MLRRFLIKFPAVKLMALSGTAFGSSFPDILALKDGSEVCGTILEKNADGGGISKIQPRAG